MRSCRGATTHRTSPHVHQPFPDHHDDMHLVGHHHEYTDIHMWYVFRYRIPIRRTAGQFTDGRWMHHTIHDASEQMQPVLRTDGQVIRALLGLIVSRPSVGGAVRQVGHGNSHFGIAGNLVPIRPQS